jgi:hypothetical protein
LRDVLIEGDDVLDDGVNVAARLEGIAEPGGIWISDAAYQQVRDRVDANFEDAGEQQLKNIARPVRVCRVRPSGAAATTRPSLPLPDKPSIAVLPFENMSGDPEQEYFADGIVDEIITALSRFKELFVIARNSSFKRVLVVNDTNGSAAVWRNGPAVAPSRRAHGCTTETSHPENISGERNSYCWDQFHRVRPPSQ